MATQTPASASKASGPSAAKTRIMRIGIVQGGRIVEERLIRKRENISIGWSSRATFAVPSESLPKQWLLFEADPKGYIAHFGDAMDARTALEAMVRSDNNQLGRIHALWTLEGLGALDAQFGAYSDRNSTPASANHARRSRPRKNSSLRPCQSPLTA